MQKINLDGQFKKALDLLENSTLNIFLTGKAGTGKTTLLSYFKNKSKKNIVLLAPTGIAALNIKGETIHSFFGFKPGITVENAKKQAKKIKNKHDYNHIDMIIIDEISMVRADLLDCVDVFLKTLLKKNGPFGGTRLIFIGDMYQLPPVVTKSEKQCFENVYDSPYFFSSNIMKDKDFKLLYLELEKVYRQKDEKFIDLLNAIRKNSITEKELTVLNKNVCGEEKINDKGFIYLTSTNALCTKINIQKLSKLKGKCYEFEALFEGEFRKEMAPTDILLKLKTNAQVMFLTNHSKGLWFNGTIGKISNIINNIILVELENGKIVEVKKYEWTIYKYNFDSQKNRIIQEEIGCFEQYPLKLAWAITIHKSQGKTFEKIILDLERGAFAHGQVYVAISRCKTFEYLILKKPLQKKHIRMDYKVMNFLTKFQYDLSEIKYSKKEKIDLIEKAIQKKQFLNITYLKTNDQKSKRTILPIHLGNMSYKTKIFFGLKAFCKKRNEERIFKIERILDICKIDN